MSPLRSIALLFLSTLLIVGACDKCPDNPKIDTTLGWFPFQRGNYWKSKESFSDGGSKFEMKINSVVNNYITSLGEELEVASFRKGHAEAFGFRDYLMGLSLDGLRLYFIGNTIDIFVRVEGDTIDDVSPSLIITFPSDPSITEFEDYVKGLGPRTDHYTVWSEISVSGQVYSLDCL